MHVCIVQLNSIPGEVLCAGRENLCCNLAELNADFMSLFLERYNGDAMNVPPAEIVKGSRSSFHTKFCHHSSEYLLDGPIASNNIQEVRIVLSIWCSVA